jgi:hypothetical protein
MAHYNFNVKMEPEKVYEVLINEIGDELIYEEKYNVNQDHHMYVLLFERNYFRTSNKATLTVTIKNVNGMTEVNAVSLGTSLNLFLIMDWDAKRDFAYEVKEMFKSHIV